jgi:hypothetical protein
MQNHPILLLLLLLLLLILLLLLLLLLIEHPVAISSLPIHCDKRIVLIGGTAVYPELSGFVAKKEAEKYNLWIH